MCSRHEPRLSNLTKWTSDESNHHFAFHSDKHTPVSHPMFGLPLTPTAANMLSRSSAPFILKKKAASTSPLTHIPPVERHRSSQWQSHSNYKSAQKLGTRFISCIKIIWSSFLLLKMVKINKFYHLKIPASGLGVLNLSNRNDGRHKEEEMCCGSQMGDWTFHLSQIADPSQKMTLQSRDAFEKSSPDQ